MAETSQPRPVNGPLPPQPPIAQLILWGTVLAAVAGVLMIFGLSHPNDDGSVGAQLYIGVVCAALSLPLILTGAVAAGVRLAAARGDQR